MGRPRKWTDQALRFKAAEYSGLKAWELGCRSSNIASRRRGYAFHTSVSSHMSRYEQADKDVVYIWQLSGYRRPADKPVYKIGTTTRKRGKARIRRVERTTQRLLGCSATDIRIFPVTDARAAEREALLLGENPNFAKFDGSTEFRYLDRSEYAEVLCIFTKYADKTKISPEQLTLAI